jgi:hypothetical protein
MGKGIVRMFSFNPREAPQYFGQKILQNPKNPTNPNFN